MIKPTNYSFKAVIFLFLAALFYFPACNSNSPSSSANNTTLDIEKTVGIDSPPSTEAVKQFFIAWMADAANDLSSDHFERGAKRRLRDTASTHIKKALNDTTISNVIGKNTLVWGPALVISEQLGRPYPYTIENLMYCTRTEGTNQYAIGIAGTNMVSSDDWLKEDFNVNWVSEPITGGKISKGSSIGLTTLEQLQDYEQGNTLLRFLQSELNGKANAVISVAGHSLGGALTQVYSNYLRNQLDSTIKVEAWVYAGPTAGNKVFADALVNKLGVNNYHAYNNRLDVVPHVWQADSLKKVCSIYNDKKICNWPIGENPIVNMVNQYLIDISTTSNDKFAIPGTPHTFSVKRSDSLVDCVDLFEGIAAAWEEGSLKDATKPFIGKCGISEATLEENTYYLMLFLAELGEQHTTAYTDYFFHDEALRNAVGKYASPYMSDTQEASNADEGLIILTKFLGRVNGNFNSGNPPKCVCE